jgi:hypothetical protein
VPTQAFASESCVKTCGQSEQERVCGTGHDHYSRRSGGLYPSRMINEVRIA